MQKSKGRRETGAPFCLRDAREGHGGRQSRNLCRVMAAASHRTDPPPLVPCARRCSRRSDMTQNNRRLLDVDIPAQPDVLVQLSLLLAEEDVDLNAASLLITSDMALAAAVLKAVNSAMYGCAAGGKTCR